MLLNPYRFRVAGGSGGGGADPNYASVMSLLHFDGADASTSFTDQIGHTWTASGNAQIDTAQSQFGGASLLLDGSGDWIDSSTSTTFYLPADFTIEFWIRPTGVSGLKYVFDFQDGTTSGDRPSFYLNGSGFQFVIAGSLAVDVASGAFTADTWHHVACVRSGSACRVFINGVQSGATGAKATAMIADRIRIGNNMGNNFPFAGHIDDFRLTKGVARYTANFTPPTAAFPNS